MIKLTLTSLALMRQQKTIPTIRPKDKRFTATILLTRITAFRSCARTISYSLEIRCYARAVVRYVGDVVGFSAAGEIGAEDVGGAAGVVEGWAGEDGCCCCGCGDDAGGEDCGVCCYGGG